MTWMILNGAALCAATWLALFGDSPWALVVVAICFYGLWAMAECHNNQVMRGLAELELKLFALSRMLGHGNKEATDEEDEDCERPPAELPPR